MDEEIDGFDAELGELEASLGSATAMVAAFQGELRTMQETMLYTGREVQGLSRSFGTGLRRAFDGVVFDGMRLSDALRSVAQSMVDAAYNTAIRPVQNAVGGLLALLVAHTLLAGPATQYATTISKQLFGPERYLTTVLETPGKLSDGKEEAH